MQSNPRLIALLAAAIGVPYTATETDLGRQAVSMLSSGSESVASGLSRAVVLGESDGAGLHTHRDVERVWENSVDRYRYSEVPSVVATSNPAALSASATQLVGRPVADLREVIRFDISPDWVTANFSRVSTVLAELQLDGLRVPLVTGTQPEDLAGSITYYFDPSGRLQRVMLHGFTGDVSKIVTTMTQHYGLQSEPTLEAGVFTRRWNGKPVHFLRITRAPIVYSDALHHKFTVFLELNQPDLRHGISPEAERIVTADRSTGRW